MFKTLLLISFLLLKGGVALNATIIPITGRIINEKTKAPVYKADIYILNTDLNVKSSETGSFNFLANGKSGSDTITLLIARYEYESKIICFPLAQLIKERPTISMVRYFRTPEVLNYPNLVVSGKVIDEVGNPLDNVAIYASSTTGYTYSDASGKFTLRVKQMRPNVLPTLWFCKNGYQTRQIGLIEFKKRKIIQLSKITGKSQSLTIKYQNTDSELLESVYVALDGKIHDRTGILGTVTLGIEAGIIQTIRISQRYRSTPGVKHRLAKGSVHLELSSLKPDLTFMLTRNYKFILAPEFQNLAVIDGKDFLPYQDSLLIAQLEPIPDPHLEGSIFVQYKSPRSKGNTFEAGKDVRKEQIELPVVDLPDIHITISPASMLPIPPTPDRHEQLAQLVSDSSEILEANLRSAETLNKAIRNHDRVIQDCYKTALKKNPYLKGTLELRLVLNPKGEIEQVEMISSTLAESEMERCIIEKIMKWNYFQPIDLIYGNRTYRLKYNFGNLSN